jgi:xanthine dehydrogenase accessory factor
MRNQVFDSLAQCARTGEAVALGVLTRVQGSSPQRAGAKALFFEDGRIVGTLGGGCLEAEAQRRAIRALSRGRGETFQLVLDHDFGWDDGLLCGGTVSGLLLPHAQEAGADFWAELAERRRAVSWGVTHDFGIRSCGSPDPRPEEVPEWLYQETVVPPCALWIAGAGHIAQAVAPLALQLDFEVTVMDDRPALVTHNRFPAETILRAEVWEKLLSLPPPPTPSFGLIVTRGHRHDALVLRDWIQKPFLFLGMIGSARKARAIHEHFISEKLATPGDFQRVACPVGLPIHSETVLEIAVSIMAQFILKRAELAAGPPSPGTKAPRTK